MKRSVGGHGAVRRLQPRVVLTPQKLTALPFPRIPQTPGTHSPSSFSGIAWLDIPNGQVEAVVSKHFKTRTSDQLIAEEAMNFPLGAVIAFLEANRLHQISRGRKMTERSYRLIIGLSLLGILYLNSGPAMYGLIALMVFEAITNWRMPLLISRLRYGVTASDNQTNSEDCLEYRFSFEAERALRLVFSSVLLVTYVMFNQKLWLFPWFAGFALAVAGLSGICPMLLFLEKLGFKPSNRANAVGAQG